METEGMEDQIYRTAFNYLPLMTQWVKNLLPIKETQEMQVRSLGWDKLLKQEMATHSTILVWKIPCTEEPGGLHSPWGHKSWTRLRN